MHYSEPLNGDQAHQIAYTWEFMGGDRWKEKGSYSALWHSPWHRQAVCSPSFYNWLHLRRSGFCRQIPRRVAGNGICLLPQIFLHLSSSWTTAVTFLNLYLSVVLFIWILEVFSQPLQPLKTMVYEAWPTKNLLGFQNLIDYYYYSIFVTFSKIIRL